MKTVLIHVCCGNCLIYPYRVLKEEGFDIHGLWFNPNIHPFQEHQRRLFSFSYWAYKNNFNFFEIEFDFDKWLREIKSYEDRCFGCYILRIRETAKFSKEKRYDYFTTTLLYSKHQKHEIIKRIGEEIEKEYRVKFLYYDFRKGWKEGIEESKKLNLYRQNYCGCIYSEIERSSKKDRKGRK